MNTGRTVRTSEALGRTLRDARRERGWTQGALATRAGVSQPTVSNFERGVGDASLSTLWKLLAALERDIQVTQRARRSAVDVWDD